MAATIKKNCDIFSNDEVICYTDGCGFENTGGGGAYTGVYETHNEECYIRLGKYAI